MCVCVRVSVQCFFIIVCYTWKTNTRWWYYALVIFSALIHSEKKKHKWEMMRWVEMCVCVRVNIFDGGYSTRNKHTKNSFGFTLFCSLALISVCECGLNIRKYCCSFRRALPFNLSCFFFCMYLTIFHHLLYRFCFNFYRVISSHSLSPHLSSFTLCVCRSFRNLILPLHGMGTHTGWESFFSSFFRKLHTYRARDIVKIEKKIRTHTHKHNKHKRTKHMHE